MIFFVFSAWLIIVRCIVASCRGWWGWCRWAASIRTRGWKLEGRCSSSVWGLLVACRSVGLSSLFDCSDSGCFRVRPVGGFPSGSCSFSWRWISSWYQGPIALFVGVWCLNLLLEPYLISMWNAFLPGLAVCRRCFGGLFGVGILFLFLSSLLPSVILFYYTIHIPVSKSSIYIPQKYQCALII